MISRLLFPSPVCKGFAVFVDHGYVVCVGVGVDTRDDFCWFACQDGNCPSVEFNTDRGAGQVGRQNGNGTGRIRLL